MKKTLVAAFSVLILSASALVAQAEKPALGVTMSDETVGGVTITGVVPGSPASRIGLQSGDRILAINGQPTTDFRDVTRIIGASRPNASVELTVARGGWQGKLTTELGSASVVFVPAPQPVQVRPQYIPASAPVYAAPAAAPAWSGFPFDFLDNGSRGASASYGGGGY